MNTQTPFLLCSSLILWASASAYAQDDEFVTYEEFDEAMAELDSLRAQVNQAKPGDTSFLTAGYFTTGYTNAEGQDSTFFANFAPSLLWTFGDNILFESELHVANGESVELDYAQFSYIVSDKVTLGAGQFLSPFGLFSERVHPTWVNKLPTAPLIAGHEGLTPSTILGFQVRGGMDIGTSRMNYAIFAGNGPSLVNGIADPDEAGSLEWGTGPDGDNNKTVGGRVGILPMPGLEVGASYMTGSVAADGTSQPDVDLDIYGFDITAIHEFDSLNGVLRFEGEYINSDVGTTTFFPTSPTPVSFNNERSGGYGQLAYRPTLADSALLKDTELVCRYDWLDLPDGAPEDEQLTRWTVGVNYWMGPSSVIKFAAEQLETSGAPDATTFYIQLALGF